MKVEINPECASKIIAEDLKWHVNNFKSEIKKAKSGDAYFHFFSKDVDEDIEKMKEMLNAMKIVLKYYGG